MPVPGVVFADLVVVQAGLVLGELGGLFHTPAGSGDPDQFGYRGRVLGVDDVVGQLGGFADRAAGQQLMCFGFRIDEQPVIQALALAARPGPKGAASPVSVRARRGHQRALDRSE